MQKINIALFILLTPALLAAQNITPYKVSDHNKFSWLNIEKKVPQAVITRFIADEKGEFPAYRNRSGYGYTIKELPARLHFIDINNDGANDVIFEGAGGGEGNVVEIFLSTKPSYKKVFEDKEGVSNIIFENNKLKELIISDWGCCEDYLNFDKTFSVSFSAPGSLTFTLVSQTASVFQGISPDTLFEKSFAFEILNDDYNLRSRPAVDDSSYEPWGESSSAGRVGNVVAVLYAGTKGIAIGKQTDNTGRGWWYIELDENVALKKSVFYENENKFSTKKRGWISSRFVKIL